MNRRVGIVAVLLIFAGALTVSGVFSQAAPQATRKAINMPGRPVQAPFSDAILSGNTLYLAGRIGLDPKTGQAPDKIEDEIKILLDGEKDVLAQAGMTILCTTNSTRHTRPTSPRTRRRERLSGRDRYCAAGISSCRRSPSSARFQRKEGYRRKTALRRLGQNSAKALLPIFPRKA